MALWTNSNRKKIKLAKEKLQIQLNNIPNSERERYYWKLKTEELLKKYLGSDHTYAVAFSTFKFENPESDNPNFGYRKFQEFDTLDDAKKYLSNSISWIEEHGLKREPFFTVIKEYYDFFGLLFTLGIAVGAISADPISELIKKNQKSSKDTILEDSIRIIPIKQPEKKQLSKHNSINEPKKDRALTPAEKDEIISKIPLDYEVNTRCDFLDKESVDFSNQIEVFLENIGRKWSARTRRLDFESNGNSRFKISKHESNPKVMVITVYHNK